MVAQKLQQFQYNLRKGLFGAFGSWHFLCFLGQVTVSWGGLGVARSLRRLLLSWQPAASTDFSSLTFWVLKIQTAVLAHRSCFSIGGGSWQQHIKDPVGNNLQLYNQHYSRYVMCTAGNVVHHQPSPIPHLLKMGYFGVVWFSHPLDACVEPPLPSLWISNPSRDTSDVLGWSLTNAQHNCVHTPLAKPRSACAPAVAPQFGFAGKRPRPTDFMCNACTLCHCYCYRQGGGVRKYGAQKIWHQVLNTTTNF